MYGEDDNNCCRVKISNCNSHVKFKSTSAILFYQIDTKYNQLFKNLGTNQLLFFPVSSSLQFNVT